MKTVKSVILLALYFLAIAGLQADEILFKDGTEIKDCLVRDEGRVMRVWPSLEDFPDRSRVYPRDDVERFRIQRGPEWDAHEDLQDLSVTHIELSPPLAGLHGAYDYDPRTGAPRLKARLSCAAPDRIRPDQAKTALPDMGEANRLDPEKVVEGLKLHYDRGETLTLSGHVKNTGFAAAQPFDYCFELNGEEIDQGRFDKRLEEMETAVFQTKIRWPGGDPVARFRVIPGVKEIAAFNDERKDVLSAWGFDYTVTHRRVAYAHRHRNTLGSFSWEDYYQWHLDIMNRLFAESVYPSAPDGIEARVRLNRIFYLDEVEERTIDDKVAGEDGLVRNQGAWHFRDNDNDRRGDWHRPFDQFFGCVTEWSLPHELGHQLGLIDYYNLDYHGSEGFPVAGREAPLRFSHFFRHPRVMMHWHGPHLWHELTAAYLNRTRGKPRGIFGDYLFETPERSLLQILDINARPVAGVEVEIYQRGSRALSDRRHVSAQGVEWFDVEEDGRFESRFYPSCPVIRGVTDSEGFLELPNRPAHPVRTLNGYERRPNPFGNMNVVGQRGLMLVLATRAGRTNPFFLELTDFNLACVRGRSDMYVTTLKGDFPSNDGPLPPACVRLEYLEGGRWRMHWKKPYTGSDTSNQSVHRYRIYRRCGNEGLNFDPWDPVATLEAGAESFDLPAFPGNPAHAVGALRRVYGITSVNERGVESEAVSRMAPDLDRVTGLIRARPFGDFFISLESDISLVKLGPQGQYEDFTPVNAPMGKAGHFYAINEQGRMVSTAWDRHGVNLYGKDMEPSGGIGEPFTAGEAPGRFRHPRACAIDKENNVAVVDGENRRVQIFDARRVWGEAATAAKTPVIIIDDFAGKPFDVRPHQVAFDHGLCLVYDVHGRLYAYQVRIPRAEAEPLFQLEIGGQASLCVEDPDRFLVLNHDRAWLRRFDRSGRQLAEIQVLNGVKLERPRGLALLEDGRVATFQNLNGILIGAFPREEEAAAASAPPPLEGIYRHPLRYEQPELLLKVLVVNYEPMLPAPGGGMARLTELMGWQDPKDLTEAYCRELRLMSGGYLDCEIREWRDVDGWPMKVDGFVYDDETYLAALKTGKYRAPDGMDYRKFAEEHDLANLVARGEIDEVWVFGGPGFGYYESRMYGPGAYWCNAPGLEMPEAKRLFVVMGYNYERGLAEVIHDLGHRLESIMSRVYENDFGGWKAEERRNDWERFSCVDHYVNGWSAVGDCHFPCNGEAHYDYANPRTVMSCAEDWLGYPDLTGRFAPVGREAWDDGSGDFHLGYMRWIFSHLPRAPGRNHEGRLCNWWNYLFDMSTHPETR